MCFKDIWKVKSAYKAQPARAWGLSFLAVSEKKIAFSKPVTVYAFQIYADEWLRISSWNLSWASCPDHSGAVPEIPKPVLHPLVFRSAALHFTMGTVTKGGLPGELKAADYQGLKAWQWDCKSHLFSCLCPSPPPGMLWLAWCGWSCAWLALSLFLWFLLGTWPFPQNRCSDLGSKLYYWNKGHTQKQWTKRKTAI